MKPGGRREVKGVPGARESIGKGLQAVGGGIGGIVTHVEAESEGFGASPEKSFIDIKAYLLGPVGPGHQAMCFTHIFSFTHYNTSCDRWGN